MEIVRLELAAIEVQVVQEIGLRVMIVVKPAVASLDAVGTIAELRFLQKENVYQALRVQHGHMITKISFGLP